MASAITEYYNRGMSRLKSNETKERGMEAAVSGIAGAGLAFLAANSKTGLDVTIPGSSKTAPLDIGIGILMTGGSMFLPIDKDMRDLAAHAAGTCIGIGVFRHAQTYFKGKTAAAHGELGELGQYFGDDADMGIDDPVVRVARGL